MKIVSLNRSENGKLTKTPLENIRWNDGEAFNDSHGEPHRLQPEKPEHETTGTFTGSTGDVINRGNSTVIIGLRGLTMTNVHPLDQFVCGTVQLEVTRTGAITPGADCVVVRETEPASLPPEGISCRIIKGGELRTGDEIRFQPKEFTILVITLSDRCYSGSLEDTGGPMVVQKIRSLMDTNDRKSKIETAILPDEPKLIAKKMKSAFENNYDLIVTTGSTGIGPRDIAPETIKPLLDKEIPGIMDRIRIKYGAEKPNALISRAIAGTKSKTLVFAIPGSLRAVNEYMEEINQIIFHCFDMLYAIDHHS
ncbi:molybdenum cofactor synthesis domain-containing protein [Gaoshiqia sp. Z1-71]|uniref:molybdenum cofactor synthesis domain-containing protein n=1 Tax=Gaoshiqia hydrogeniformans TaxID=3290090 RepID=UPI003BF80D20